MTHSSLMFKTVKHFAILLCLFLSIFFKSHTGKVCVRDLRGKKEAKIEKRMNTLSLFRKAEKRL